MSGRDFDRSCDEGPGADSRSSSRVRHRRAPVMTAGPVAVPFLQPGQFTRAQFAPEEHYHTPDEPQSSGKTHRLPPPKRNILLADLSTNSLLAHVKIAGPNSEATFLPPFGIDDSNTDVIDNNDIPSDQIVVQRFPRLLHLERTNFLVKCGKGDDAVSRLFSGLGRAFEVCKVDMLEFTPARCAVECSYHQENQYLSFFVGIFLPPDEDQLIKADESSDSDEDEEYAFLIEIQLREGDRFCFMFLFQDIMTCYKEQEDVVLLGTYRYHSRAAPARGDGLLLENIRQHPRDMRSSFSRSTSRSMSSSGGLTPSSGEVRCPSRSDEGGESSSDDRLADLKRIRDVLRSSFVDVQADTAATIAGLTFDGVWLAEVCKPEYMKVAVDIFAIGAMLFRTTRFPAVKRQTAVILANVCDVPELREQVILSDVTDERELVRALVATAMGQALDIEEARDNFSKEEEIGTRRASMRALVSLVKEPGIPQKNQGLMRLLLSQNPTGMGSSDRALKSDLTVCRETIRTVI